MIRALTLLFACLAAGELLIYLTHVKLPSSIIGLLILFGLLQAKWVHPEWFKPVTDFLMQNLMLMIIVPCVALVQYLDLLQHNLLAIVFSSIGGTIFLLFFTAKTHEWVSKKIRKNKDKAS